eukprot:TRINITY_DN844_c0_g1_i3.p1 TRINITY_DN844_c0_g1~~TRINITY_DN844_c0_g1_i3.p1  ORF type:complete len:307 (+),score=109.26 TRINITY_DN844_c0_g1_i3:116-1036(+)
MGEEHVEDLPSSPIREEIPEKEVKPSLKRRLGDEGCLEPEESSKSTEFQRRGGPPPGSVADLAIRLRVTKAKRARLERYLDIVENGPAPKPETPKKPLINLQTEDRVIKELGTKEKTRGRRLFGVLQNHLSGFTSKAMEKRAEAAKQKREETEARLNKKFEEEKNLSIEEKKRVVLELIEEEKKLQEEYEERSAIRNTGILKNKWTKHHLLVAHSIETKTGPAIRWIPKKHNDETLDLLEESREAQLTVRYVPAEGETIPEEFRTMYEVLEDHDAPTVVSSHEAPEAPVEDEQDNVDQDGVESAED